MAESTSTFAASRRPQIAPAERFVSRSGRRAASFLSTELRIGYGDCVKPRVYLETSVVSYLVGRLSRDVIVLGNQELTREWWASKRMEYDLFISEVVIGEVGIGDAEMARQRLELSADLPLLGVTEEAEGLAPLLLKAAGLPPKAATDALHMAVAAVHGMDYLLSWNCRHIANATIRRAIERTCRASGYDPPVICTPQELIER